MAKFETLQQFIATIDAYFNRPRRSVTEEGVTKNVLAEALKDLGIYVAETSTAPFVEQQKQEIANMKQLVDNTALVVIETGATLSGQISELTIKLNTADDLVLEMEEIRDSGLNPFLDRGDWNPNTNTPQLSADATVGSVANRTQFYTIVVAGTLPFAIKGQLAGTPIGKGTLVQHPTGEWYFTDKDAGVLQQVNDLKAVAMKSVPTTQQYTIQDPLGWSITGVTLMGEVFPPRPRRNNKIEKANLSTAVLDLMPTFLDIHGISEMDVDPAGWAVNLINSKGRRLNPFSTADLDPTFFFTRKRVKIPGVMSHTVDNNGISINGLLDSGEPFPPIPRRSAQSSSSQIPAKIYDAKLWVNKHPQIPRRLKKTFAKIAGKAGASVDNPFIVVADSDSIWARENWTSVKDVVPHSFPPGCTTKNFAAWFWQTAFYNLERPVYSRYDKPGVFTETGAWVENNGVAADDDNGDRPNESKRSSAAGATVQFIVGAGFGRFNFIDRANSVGSQAITISCNPGTLEVMLPGTDIWVEANGAVLSQRHTATGRGVGNAIYQRRTWFKKVGAGIGAEVQVTMTKNADSSMFYYWGIEQVTGLNQYFIFYNVGRGGHSLHQTTNESLANYFITDIVDRKPDLLIFEVPCINMAGGAVLPNTFTNPDFMPNQVQDCFFGDRAGYVNDWNLLALSEGQTKFEILAVLPHNTRGGFNPDGTLITLPNGFNRRQAWGHVKSLFIEKDLIPVIDISEAFVAEAYDKYSGNMYSMLNAHMVADGTHPNDLGTEVYVKNLAPVFNQTSF